MMVIINYDGDDFVVDDDDDDDEYVLIYLSTSHHSIHPFTNIYMFTLLYNQYLGY